MDDVQRALERATRGMVAADCFIECDGSIGPKCGLGCYRAAMGAILACAKALPTTMTVAELVAAIEEQQG